MGDFAGNDFFCELSFDLFLDEAFEWAGTVDGVVALFADPVFGVIIELDRDGLFCESGVKAFYEEVDNFLDFWEGERFEEDGIVDTVKEFWAEGFTEFCEDFFFNILRDLVIFCT